MIILLVRSGGKSHKSSGVNERLNPIHAKLVNQENARSEGKLAESFGHWWPSCPQRVSTSEHGDKYLGNGSAQNCKTKLVKAPPMVRQ